MRARNIKPGFFNNDQLAECSFAARILFEGLWCLADREGRLEDRPKKIRVEIFPYDMIDADELLNELAAQKLIVRYEADGERYIWIPTFLKHQKPHPKENDSTIPAYEECSQEQEPEQQSNHEQEQESTEKPHLGMTQFVPGCDPVHTQVWPKSNLGDHQTTPRCDQDNTQVCTDPAESLNPESLNPESLNLESLNPNIGAENASAQAPCPDKPVDKSPNCPTKQIIALYHELLPELPNVMEWAESSKRMIVTRWREKKERQSLDWWREYFLKVKASDFLTGR